MMIESHQEGLVPYLIILFKKGKTYIFHEILSPEL